MTEVTCHCGSPMELRDSKHGPFWGCTRFPDCRGTHGAHPDGEPLGVPGDKATRRARMDAHAVFDDWWQNNGMSKKEAYRWMEENAPQEHIGMMDADECEKLIELLEDEQ